MTLLGVLCIEVYQLGTISPWNNMSLKLQRAEYFKSNLGSRVCSLRFAFTKIGYISHDLQEEPCISTIRRLG
jgi:hypothetical protein